MTASAPFDWDGYYLFTSAAEFAFSKINRGLRAGDGAAVVGGVSTILRNAETLLRAAGRPTGDLKRALSLLPARPPIEPTKLAPSVGNTLTNAADPTMSGAFPDAWGYVGAILGEARMVLIQTRITGPFDPLGSALLDATMAGKRTSAEGHKPPQAVADAVAKEQANNRRTADPWAGYPKS